MRRTIILILFFFNNDAFSQKVTNENIFYAFVNDTLFCQKVVPSCSGYCDTLVVIDTLKSFDIKKLPSKKRLMNITYLQEYAKVTKEIPVVISRKCKLFIRIEYVKKQHRVYFYSSVSNGLGHFDYKTKRGVLFRINDPVIAQY